MRSRPLAAAVLAAAIACSYPTLPVSAQTSQIAADWSSNQWMLSSDLIRRRVNDLPDKPALIIPIPILFGVSTGDFIQDFGDPRSGGRRHEGQDLLAPKGTPIVSPTEAVVLATGVWTGGGNYVSTANPGGERFIYMHLDRPSARRPGDRLRPGDLIGYVGNTGNAVGTSPHLHFEIRKGSPIDPYPRLKKEFSLEEKMEFTEEILEEDPNSAALARFLAGMYRGEFLAADGLGIEVPPAIGAEMGLGAATRTAANTTAKPVPAQASGLAVNVPTRNLEVGAQGADVIWLQNFLIALKSGPAAAQLAQAGATGYFGPVTRAALAEYQAKAGIAPASGYFGPITRARLAATITGS